jgi:hypothetical protein
MDIAVIVPALIIGMALSLVIFVPKETRSEVTTPPPPVRPDPVTLTLGEMYATVDEFFESYPVDFATVEERQQMFREYVAEKWMVENFGEDGLH